MKRMAYLGLALMLASQLAVAVEAVEGVDALLESKEPATPLERAFIKMDANHDGSVSRGELQLKQTALLLDNYDLIDTNKDSGLSLQEIQKFMDDLRTKQEAFLKRMQAADKDGDGAWTLKELKSAKQKLPSLEKKLQGHRHQPRQEDHHRGDRRVRAREKMMR